MKLRVKYDKRLGLWFGQVKYKDNGVWLIETRYYCTKYGAKRELRKWYKREVTPEKIEEIDPQDLVGGELIDIFKTTSDWIDCGLLCSLHLREVFVD